MHETGGFFTFSQGIQDAEIPEFDMPCGGEGRAEVDCKAMQFNDTMHRLRLVVATNDATQPACGI